VGSEKVKKKSENTKGWKERGNNPHLSSDVLRIILLKFRKTVVTL
jgi:hypothetical protein